MGKKRKEELESTRTSPPVQQPAPPAAEHVPVPTNLPQTGVAQRMLVGAADILRLQRSIGNRSMQSMLRPAMVQRRPAGAGIIQRKWSKAQETANNAVTLNHSVNYERNLGRFLFNHAPAVATAQMMLDRMRDALIPAFDQHNAAHQQQLGAGFGGNSAGGAGQVGTAFQDVFGVFQNGNLREKMTALYNGMNRPFKQLVEQLLHNEDWADAGNRGLDVAKLRHRNAQMKYQPWTSDLYRGKPRNPFDQKSMLSTDLRIVPTETRTASAVPQTTRTVGDLRAAGTPLSDREAALQFGAGFAPGMATEAGLPAATQLKWFEGGTYWQMKNNNIWVKKVRDQLHMPVVAGPSGTAHRFFQIWEFLGKPVNADDLKLSVLGYMLAENDHSFHEMMMEITKFGVPYKPGMRGYRNLPPLAEALLRANVADNGTFPDEYDYLARAQSGTDFSLVTNEHHNTLADMQTNAYNDPATGAVGPGPLAPGSAGAIAIGPMTPAKEAALLALLAYTDEVPAGYKYMNAVEKNAIIRSAIYQWHAFHEQHGSPVHVGVSASDLAREAKKHKHMVRYALEILPVANAVVYRGQGQNQVPVVGDTWTIDKLMSTSTDVNNAIDFMNRANGTYKILYTIPAGHPGKNLMDISMFGSGEAEVLMPSGSQCTITAVNQDPIDGHYDVTLTIV